MENKIIIKFNQDTELTVVSGFDEELDNITDETVETFKAGELINAEIMDGSDTNSEYVDLEFGDGSIALTVQRSSFEIVK